ncbi:MAG: nitroreductase family deazaflavin-dependent oxidoreductase [Candidatus Limnocylindrales bacterium]|nr:nitroreductase family deazaflavin-dependent oxidoreductase [Candidatus Limnocylindrales bacterium]
MDIGEQLAGWGKVALIETRGRVTGRTARAHVGFVDEPDGSIVVAAGLGASWAANLLAHPTCTVTIAERSFRGVAEPLEGVEFAAAIRELILRYGTPAERLGSGPAFRIRPVEAAEDPA